jgi:hypothetical protein
MTTITVNQAVAKSRAAEEAHRVAQAFRRPGEVAIAEHDLTEAKHSLVRARSEISAVLMLQKALSAPKRLGTQGWLK